MAIAFEAEMLSGTITQAAGALHLSPMFLGVIVLALVGTAGDLFAAAWFAHEDRMGLVLGICIGSAIQVALVVAPLLVIISWGRNPIILFAFAMLPVRALLYTASDDALWLFAVQTLEGVSTGLYSATKPLILADLMADKTRYNLASGAVATVQGVAIALSNVLAGGVVDWAGFTAAFLVSAGIGTASALLLLRMPEPAESQGSR